MLKHSFVSGHYAGSSQLVCSEEDAVLIDCAAPFCAEETILRLKAALGGRRLSAVFLSHSHYDHITALPYISDLFPDTPVYAHPYTCGVLARPGAVSVMERMCSHAAGLYREGNAPPARMGEMGELIPLSDGESFPLGGGIVRAVFTPGHTRDSVSFDFPESGFSILNETFGVLRPDGSLQPCFLSGYRDTLESLDKIERLGSRRFFLSHTDIEFDAAKNAGFIEASRRVVRDSAELICRLHDKGLDPDGIFREYTKIYWSEAHSAAWPFSAYELNTRAAIKTALFELRPHPLPG